MLGKAILALHYFPMASHGFANNLVGSSTGCMTELDTSEVIMNSVVKPHEESDFPNMHLVVIKDDNHMESPFHYTPSEEQFTIAFVNPYSKDEFQDDLQFVMDVEGPAEFVGGGYIGCEGNKRVASRLFDGGQVQLKILDPTASLRIWAGWATGHEAVRLTPNMFLEPKPSATPKSPETKKDEISEKVDGRLKETPKPSATPKIPEISEKVAGHLNEISEKVAGHLKDRELKGPRDAHVKGESPTVPEIVELDTPDKTAKKSGKKSNQKKFKKMRKGSDKKKPEKMEKMKEIKKEVDAKKLNSRWGSKIRDKVAPLRDTKEIFDAAKNAAEIVKNIGLAVEKPKLMDETERRNRLEEEMRRNFPEKGVDGFLSRYESDSFGGGLHMSGYYYGCAFFIFAFGTLLSLLSRRKEKGRRDL
jgi:hypothetical protein